MVSSKDDFETFLGSFGFDTPGSSFDCDWSSITVIWFEETYGELGLLDFAIRKTFGLTRTLFRTESMTLFASKYVSTKWIIWQIANFGQIWTNCSLPKLRSIAEALIKWFILLDKIETKDVKNESPKIIHILTKIR